MAEISTWGAWATTELLGLVLRKGKQEENSWANKVGLRAGRTCAACHRRGPGSRAERVGQAVEWCILLTHRETNDSVRPYRVVGLHGGLLLVSRLSCESGTRSCRRKSQ